MQITQNRNPRSATAPIVIHYLSTCRGKLTCPQAQDETRRWQSMPLHKQKAQASLQCSGVGEWRGRREWSSCVQGDFPWAFSGCAPGKSDPTSAAVRPACPWPLRAGLAQGEQVSGMQLPAGRRFWNPHHPDGLVSPLSYYHFTTSDNNSAGKLRSMVFVFSTGVSLL